MDVVPQLIAGRYRIEHEIGRGGMGTVYRALHLGLERPVAVKILKPELTTDPQVAERFMREARTMARLRHHSAATIFDAGTLPDNRPFIVMEYVEGATLAEVLAREGRLSFARAVQIACAICEVLAAAHTLGIVHRDLKPSNVMLGERGICVLDFGVAKVLATSADATRTHATTESGLVIGTPRYMSPEQCIGQEVGPQSDLYSLGVLLYEMIAGRPPFVDQLPSAVLVKQATAPPPPLLTLRHETPRALVLAVHALLSKRAQDRPANALAARALLEKSIAKPKPIEAPDMMPFASTVASVNNKNSYARRVFASVLFAAAISALLLFWGRSGRGAEQQQSVAAALRAAQGAPVSTTTAPSAIANTSDARLNTSSPSLLPTRITPLAIEEARDIASMITGGVVEDVRVLRIPTGPVVLATHIDTSTGSNHVYAMERHGASGQFHITANAPLDTIAFHSANWTSEVSDVDNDGYNEVIYKGTDMDGEANGGRRLVLYVPRAHKFYILRVEPHLKHSNNLRVLWSPNALTKGAAAFRSALEQRARTSIATL